MLNLEDPDVDVDVQRHSVRRRHDVLVVVVRQAVGGHAEVRPGGVAAGHVAPGLHVARGESHDRAAGLELYSFPASGFFPVL